MMISKQGVKSNMDKNKSNIKSVSNQKIESKHISNRLVATVDDISRKRTYHIIQDIDGFVVVPDQSDEYGKRWSIQSMECDCTQSEYVAECSHEEAVRKAISNPNQYKPDDRALAIAEGRAGGYDDIVWYRLLEVEKEDGKILISRNHIGDELLVYKPVDDIIISYRSGSVGSSEYLNQCDTSSSVLTPFVQTTHHRQKVLDHAKEIVISKFVNEGGQE